jgi:osmotically-inducible protein OsmY
MRRHVLLVGFALVAAGCNRQDVDGLGSISRKVLERTQSAVAPLRDNFERTLKDIGVGAGLKERVQQRLLCDKALAAATIDISVKGAEVELRGTLKSEDQRRRAVDLAETTVGVERVVDQLLVE